MNISFNCLPLHKVNIYANEVEMGIAILLTLGKHKPHESCIYIMINAFR